MGGSFVSESPVVVSESLCCESVVFRGVLKSNSGVSEVMNNRLCR